MSNTNIFNTANPSQRGYQSEGAELPAGWSADNPTLFKPTGTTPAPTPATTPSDKITGSTVRRYTGTDVTGQSEADKAQASYYNNLDTAAPDENLIRAKALQAVQANIDAVTNTYAGLMTSEKERGVNRLGQTRAVNARSGTLDSDFGAQNVAATAQVNAENEKALANEKELKIQTILGQVNKDVEDKVAAQKTLATTNTEKRLAYLEALGTKAKDQVKNLATTGVTVDQLTDTEYNHLLEATGYTPEDLKAQFILNKPKQDILHQEAIGNKYVVLSKDPLTGKVKSESIDIGFDVPQGYKTEKLDNGQVIFYPEKFDPTKSMESQIKYMGTPTPAGGKYAFTQGQKSDLLGLGFDLGAVNTLQTYLQTKSVDDALGFMKNSDGSALSDQQKSKLKSVFSGGGSGA